MLPEPGSKEWEDMAEFMRADLLSDMMLTKLIMMVRKEFKEQGKDFNEEFKKWKKSKGE
jgi:hypothetical protein